VAVLPVRQTLRRRPGAGRERRSPAVGRRIWTSPVSAAGMSRTPIPGPPVAASQFGINSA